MKGLRTNIGLATVVLLATAALAAARTTSMAVPGTVNYVEGQVALDGQGLAPKQTGSTLLGTNQVLDTGQGKAELLLTPGVFFRLGDNSEVRMVSPGLADTRVELVKGSAMLEVDQLYKENDLSVVVGESTTRIDKEGLYDFQADPAAVNVIDGKATVYEGNGHVTVKKRHEVLLANGKPLKSQGWNQEAVESDPLYRWSNLRGEYEADANVNAAYLVGVNGGWYGPGWYWDPFWSFYSYLPGDGFFYSPFGWGFYSPRWVVGHPHYRYGVIGHAGFRAAAPSAGRVSATPRTAPMSGSHGGGFAGSGFHGGGGFGGRR
jgi:hypothetical protein